MKRKKVGMVFLFLLISISMMACGDGYNTTNYIGQTLDGQSGRMLNIGDFTGSKAEQWQFEEASVMDVEITVGEGRMHFILSDPKGNVVFDQEVKEGRTFRERFEGEFLRGTYELKLESRKAKNVALEIIGLRE